VTVYGEPLEMAERWFKAVRRWLHVVDLDGAFRRHSGESWRHREIAARCRT
jgi:phosphoribosylformimino-5-aminoimidazole carboxamide ribonucleotide (ProFAR) isomerase